MHTKHNLSAKEIKCLQQVERGEFDHDLYLQQELNQLVAKGLVEIVTTLSFPIMPPRYCYRLTLYGKDILGKQRKPVAKQ